MGARTPTGASRTSSSTIPKAGEVKVKLAASGLCHSDEHLVTGDMVLDPEIAAMMGLEQFPIIGGHEGAGEVVEVGPGVTTRRSRATTSSSASSRRAAGARRAPAAGSTCATSAPSSSPAARSRDFTARHHAKDGTRPRDHVLPRHVLAVHGRQRGDAASRSTTDIPLDKAALVGCGVTTGWGAADLRRRRPAPARPSWSSASAASA